MEAKKKNTIFLTPYLSKNVFALLYLMHSAGLNVAVFNQGKTSSGCAGGKT